MKLFYLVKGCLGHFLSAAVVDYPYAQKVIVS